MGTRDHSSFETGQRRDVSTPTRQEPFERVRLARPLENTHVALASDAFAAVPEDLRGGSRNGASIIRLFTKADVDRVPDAIWQYLADRGVYQDRQNGNLQKMTAEELKLSHKSAFDTPTGGTRYYGGSGIGFETAGHGDRRAKAEGAKFSDTEVAAAIRSAMKDRPTITEAELRAKGQQLGVTREQFDRVYPGTSRTAPTAAADRGVSKWFDSQVLDAMKEATAQHGSELSKSMLKTLAQQYQVPDDQFERVYAQFKR